MIVAVVDTHAVIWYLHGSSRLSTRAKEYIETTAKQGDQLGLSTITLVEMTYLIEKGRIAVETFSLLTSVLANRGALFREIPLDLQVARALSRIDATTVPDMPDRIIAATALHIGVPIVSRDSKIRLADVQAIW